MARDIHPTAIVDPRAELAEDVVVGPYATIEGPVRVGAGTRLGPYVRLVGDTWLGAGNVVRAGAVIGEDPQDLGFDPQTPTGVRIGDRNRIREHVTIHRATRPETHTSVGDENFLMVGSHLAHDVTIGSRNVLANAVLLAGHVHVANRVVIAGGVTVHQFCRIGELAFLSGLSATHKDVPPYMKMHGRAWISGLNAVGLRRAEDISRDAVSKLKAAFRTLYREDLNVSQALEKLSQELSCDEVRYLVEFCRASKRGICRRWSRERGEAALG